MTFNPFCKAYNNDNKNKLKNKNKPFVFNTKIAALYTDELP